ncbi:MAG: hypothetical protein R2867_38185 [Caldilineaceae bacterium]
MKRYQSIPAILALAALFVGAACNAIDPARYGREAGGGYQNLVTVDDEGNTTVDAPSLATALAPIATQELSDDENCWTAVDAGRREAGARCVCNAL